MMTDREPDCSSFGENNREQAIDDKDIEQDAEDEDDDDNAMTMQDLLMESFDACPPQA